MHGITIIVKHPVLYTWIARGQILNVLTQEEKWSLSDVMSVSRTYWELAVIWIYKWVKIKHIVHLNLFYMSIISQVKTKCHS